MKVRLAFSKEEISVTIHDQGVISKIFNYLSVLEQVPTIEDRRLEKILNSPTDNYNGVIVRNDGDTFIAFSGLICYFFQKEKSINYFPDNERNLEKLLLKALYLECCEDVGNLEDKINFKFI